MPKETKAYACSWNCGRNVLTIRKRMERHEKICNWNPVMRACMTCKHFSPGGGQDEDYEPAGCDEGYDLKARLRNECDKWSNDQAHRSAPAETVERKGNDGKSN